MPSRINRAIELLMDDQPIYYDGGTSIVTKPSEKLERVTVTARKGAPRALQRLLGLDPAALRRTLGIRGVDLSPERLQGVVEKMKSRLQRMARTDAVEPVVLKTRTIYRRPKNGLSYVFATDDAGRLGLATGDWVQVSSRRGAIKLRLLVTGRSPQGTVFVPFHFAEAAANLLTLDRVDGRAKIPDYKNTAVRIEKTSPPEDLDEGYERPLFERGAIKDPVQVH